MFPTTPLGVTISASGTLLGVQPGYKIRVHAVVAVATTGTTLTFRSASSAISGAFPLAANGGFSLPFSQAPWFETNRDEALTALLSVSTPTGFQIIYSLV